MKRPIEYRLQTADERAARETLERAAQATARAAWLAQNPTYTRPTVAQTAAQPERAARRKLAENVRVIDSETVADFDELESVGIHTATGRVVRRAVWVELVDPRQRLIDILAADYAIERAARVLPADTAMRSPEALTLARRALKRAARLADGWALHADILTAEMRPITLPEVVEKLARDYAPKRARPTAGQTIHATRDPMRPTKWSLELEAGGSVFLRHTGQPFTRPDVLDRNTGLHVTRPDHICHAAVKRYVNPQPCIYGRNGYQDRVEWCRVFAVDTAGTVENTDTKIGRYLTTRRRIKTARHYVTVIERDSDTRSVLGPLEQGRIINRRMITVTEKLADDRLRHGWRGHQRIVWELAPLRGGKQAIKRAAKRAARVPGASSKGRNIGPWSMRADNLARAITGRGLADAVTAVETALRMTDGPLTFANGTTVTVMQGVEIMHADKAWPVREFSRRAVLAGIELDKSQTVPATG